MRYAFFCGLAAFACSVWAEAVPSPYGVCAHVTRGQEFPTRATAFEHIRGAGIACVRSDFDWSSVQPDASTWTFDHLDAALDDAEKAGIQLLPILAYSTRFANPAHEHLDAWKTYVRKLVERYQSRIPVWEVWNEQNIPGFWKEPDPAAYLNLLKVSWRPSNRQPQAPGRGRRTRGRAHQLHRPPLTWPARSPVSTS